MTNTAKWTVWANGIDMGVFVGETSLDALDMYAAHTGYADYHDLCDVAGCVTDYTERRSWELPHGEHVCVEFVVQEVAS